MANTHKETLEEIRAAIVQKYPNAKPIQGEENDPDHTLWMIRQLNDHCLSFGQAKTYRWVGWVLAKAHTMGLFTLDPIRDMVRADLSLQNNAKLD